MRHADDTFKDIAFASILVGSMLAAGCASQGGPSSGSASNMQVFNAYVNAWEQRNPQAIAATMAPGGTYTAPDAGERLDQKNFVGYTSALFKAIPDFTVKKAEGHMVDSDTMAEQWVVSGTWTQPWVAGPLAGLPPTGKSFTLPGAAFIDFKDGKISSIVQYFDSMSLLTQIGAIPPK